MKSARRCGRPRRGPGEGRGGDVRVLGRREGRTSALVDGGGSSVGRESGGVPRNGASQASALDVLRGGRQKEIDMITKTDARAVVESYFAAWTSHDTDKAYALLAPNLEFSGPS